MQRTILLTLWTVATTFCFAPISASAATTASNVMYFYCYGPQTKSGEPPPPKVYVSGVSSAVYSEANSDAASNEFRQFVASEYGEDFEPRCEFAGTELAATKLISILKGRYRAAAVMTTWTWSGAAAAADAPAD